MYGFDILCSAKVSEWLLIHVTGLLKQMFGKTIFKQIKKDNFVAIKIVNDS